MRIIKLTVLALCLGVSVVWADDRPIYKDKNAPIEDRVEDLLRRMTLREKVGQLQQRCTWDINNIGGTYEWGKLRHCSRDEYIGSASRRFIPEDT